MMGMRDKLSFARCALRHILAIARTSLAMAKRREHSQWPFRLARGFLVVRFTESFYVPIPAATTALISCILSIAMACDRSLGVKLDV